MIHALTPSKPDPDRLVLKRAVGIIPARFASQRLPGKALADLCGLPLVVRVWKAAIQSGLSEVFVATDDERIRNTCLENGVPVVMTSVDSKTGSDRAAEAAMAIDAEIIVNIQGDEPFIDPGLIDCLALTLSKTDAWDMATAYAPFASSSELEDPNVVKAVLGDDRLAADFARKAAADRAFLGFPHIGRHIGIYAFKKEALKKFFYSTQNERAERFSLEQLRALDSGLKIGLVKWFGEVGPGVDTPDDLERARRRFSKLSGEKR